VPRTLCQHFQTKINIRKKTQIQTRFEKEKRRQVKIIRQVSLARHLQEPTMVQMAEHIHAIIQKGRCRFSVGPKIPKTRIRKTVSVIIGILHPPSFPNPHEILRRTPDLKAHQRLSIDLPMYQGKEPSKISTWRPATEHAPYSALASTLQLDDLSPFLPVATDPLGLLSSST
jgi:hypothetical protein